MRTTEMVLFAPFLKTSKFIPACISIYMSFSCPSSVLVNMIYYCSVKKYCCSNSSIPGVILHSIMKSIKTPNHPAHHWSTLWPLEAWVRGLYNSWWFSVHKLSMFIYLSMVLYLSTFLVFRLFSSIHHITNLELLNKINEIQINSNNTI